MYIDFNFLREVVSLFTINLSNAVLIAISLYIYSCVVTCLFTDYLTGDRSACEANR